jgi:transposase
MIDMLKRHEIQVLRRAGHTWTEVAALSGVSVRTARRVAEEAAVTTVDNAAERARRRVGRPSKAEADRDVIERALTEDGTLRSVELLHRARLAGYTGGKSALYAVAHPRSHTSTALQSSAGPVGRSASSHHRRSPPRERVLNDP